MDENINIIKKNTALLQYSREVGLEVNTENAKYMVGSPHQNVGQNQNVLIFNECGKVKILGIKIAFTKKLRVYKIRGMFITILFSLLSSRLLSKNLERLKYTKL